MKKKNSVFRAIWVLLVAFTGCVSFGSRGGSGFLVDYSSLKPDPKQEGVFYFSPQQSPKLIAEKYPAVTIDPVVFYFDSDVRGLAVNPGHLQALAERFRKELTGALGGNHTVVDIPGPAVARIRIAFSGVTPSRFRLSPHPSLTAIDLGSASLEAEMIDPKTAERISALMDTRNRGGYVKLDEAAITKNAEAVIGEWAKLVADWVDGLFAIEEEPSKENIGAEEKPEP